VIERQQERERERERGWEGERKRVREDERMGGRNGGRGGAGEGEGGLGEEEDTQGYREHTPIDHTQTNIVLSHAHAISTPTCALGNMPGPLSKRDILLALLSKRALF